MTTKAKTTRRAWKPTSEPDMRSFETMIGERLKVDLKEHDRDGYRGVTMFILDKGTKDCIYVVASEVEELRRLLNWAHQTDAEREARKGRPA
jgi:hypothetical protein